VANPAEGVLPVDTVNDLLVNALQDAGIVGIDESVERAYLTRAFRQANWVLAEWARVLKVGGYMVLYVPSGNLYPHIGEEHANLLLQLRDELVIPLDPHHGQPRLFRDARIIRHEIAPLPFGASQLPHDLLHVIHRHCLALKVA
jgi:hypothetical protein